MPYGYTPPAWANTPQASSPIVGGSYSRDDRDDRDDRGHPGGWINEPSATFSPPPDHPSNAGTPIVTTNETINEPIDGRSSAILEAQEEQRLKNIQQLKSLYASTMSSPGPLGGALYEGLDLAKIFESFGNDPTVMTNEDGTVHSSMNYEDMPSQGQIPITDWDKLNYLNHLGLGGTNITGKQGLGSLFAIDSSGNAILDSSGNLIKTGLGSAMSDQFNEIVYGTPSTFNPEEQLSMEEQFEKVEKDYWTGQEQSWDSWADPWNEGYTQIEDDSLADYYRHHWFSESLSDVERREQERLDEGLGLATMGDMEQMYGSEFAAQANPLFDPGYSQQVTAELDPMSAGMELFELART